MTFSEAMKALESGEKVRCVTWIDKDEYLLLLLNPDEFICGENILPKSIAAFNTVRGNYKNVTYSYLNTAVDWEIYKGPKTKKEVWQWRYKEYEDSEWAVHGSLMCELIAKNLFNSPHIIKYEIHAGPFELEE